MKKNGFFVAAGILSIIDAVACGIGALVLLISAIAVGAVGVPGTEGLDITVTVPPDQVQLSKGALVTACVILMVFLLVFVGICIFNAKTYFANASKTYQQVHENSGRIIAAIVLSFIVGGLIVGIVGLVGYLNKPEEANNEAISVNKETSTPASDDISKKLQQLKEMRDGGLISEEEFQKAREDVLKKF